MTRASHSTRVLDGGLCLAVAGELDVTIVRDLEAWLAETGSTLAPGARFTIDLSGVTFCDASGLALLIDARRRTGPGGTVVLDGPRPQLLRLLRVTGLDRVFTVRSLGGAAESRRARSVAA